MVGMLGTKWNQVKLELIEMWSIVKDTNQNQQGLTKGLGLNHV